MKTKVLPVLLSATLTGYTGNSFAQANKQLSNLTSPTSINQNLLPFPDNAVNLGDSNKQWKSVFLHDYIYLNGILTMHTTGSNNYFSGPGAGNTAVTDYGNNTATGTNALHNLTTGYENTATGAYAMFSNTTGIGNTATGIRTLFSNTTGTGNTATGFFALFNNTNGRENTATGDFALYNNTTGHHNTATGYGALLANIGGNRNAAFGDQALNSNTTGNDLTAIGDSALVSNNTGTNNTAVGARALRSNIKGIRNTALGVSAGASVSAGARNTFIGYRADGSKDKLNNATALGNESVVNASNTVRVGNSAITSIGGYVGWTTISDGRVKKNLKSNVPGLSFINKLKPITYNINLEAAEKIVRGAVAQTDGYQTTGIEQMAGTVQNEKEQVVYTGFIAQEVEKTAKELNFDFSGVDAAKNDNDLYGLRYAEFVAPLVKAVQELSRMNDEKDTEINQLQQRLNEQQKQIDELKFIVKGSVFNAGSKQSAVKLSSAALLQNVPNPASGITTISYNIPQQYATAEIIITDKQGRTLKE